MDNAVWLWSTSGKFRPYDEATSACIEEAYQKGLANIRVRLWRGAEQADYSIDFRKMRQVNLRDPQKWRHVKRSAKTREVPQGAPAMPASEAKDTPMALEVRWKGTRKSFHLTSQAAAESIIQSGKFHHSKRGMMGPFIYFAGSPEDCDGKANGARLVDGAVLQATVDLGQSLVIRQDMSSAAQSSLGISRWSELDRAKLQQVGCQSVYATSDFVSRDEWAVVSNSQIRDLVLKGFESRGRPLPYWQWPRWVHSLANAVNVDYIAIDRVTEGAAGRTDPAPPGVRVNSAGRPVHSDGRFMSYSEARQLGWGQAPPPSPNPWNEHQKRMGGQGYSQAQIRQAYTFGSSQGSLGSIARQTNPWNEHQKRMGGQGYSQADILAAYRPTSASSLGGGGGSSGGLGWNKFRTSMAGQGLSRSEMSAAYWA
ncbi:unnamed protein product [Effrenium voratum]|uniref:WWE domain-containing protein n=1 Tax=Effrenium voratum TaxID=2562239 RepID=A0AA36MHM0_9DINO|nr:unnamed protein product [Effrenium voratum]